MIRYEFRDAAGQIQSGSADLDFGEWQRLVPGATVRIEYLRSDPARNRPALAGDWLFLLGVGLAIGGVTALFGGQAFLRRRIRVINEQVRLTLKGRPVLGLVEAVERHAPRRVRRISSPAIGTWWKTAAARAFMPASSGAATAGLYRGHPGTHCWFWSMLSTQPATPPTGFESDPRTWKPCVCRTKRPLPHIKNQ